MGVLPQIGTGGWYLLHGDKPHGPFPISAFLGAVEEGTITKDHYVWRPGWNTWRRGQAAVELLTVSPTEDALVEFGAVPPPPPGYERSSAAADDAAGAASPSHAEEVNLDVLERHMIANVDERLDLGSTARLDLSQRNWRSDLGLTKSHWIKTILAVTIVCSSIFVLRALLAYAGPRNGILALGAWIVFCLLVLAVVVWQFVGLWRSASSRQERGGSVFLARAAQVMVVIGVSAAIITWAADSARYASSSTLVVSAPVDKVGQSLVKIPAYATLQRIAPTAFDSLSAQVSEQFAQDASTDAIPLAARDALALTVKSYAPHASDEAILEMADVYVAYMNGLKEGDPESCVAINDDSKGARMRADLLKQFPTLVNRELAADERILATAAANSQPIPTGSQVLPQLTMVQEQMTQRFDRQLELLSKPSLKPSEYPGYCQMALALFEEIRRLPRKQAADLLRYVYAKS
jgi:uncharacterized protein DUF4339